MVAKKNQFTADLKAKAATSHWRRLALPDLRVVVEHSIPLRPTSAV